ncbi:hypothetical protein [Gemmatimonas aurantiaca]|uniref:hypothetical protein n=1 Tax=Gemmatimonas aurantiaca TaxID=173480 RepID=UPI00301D8A56
MTASLRARWLLVASAVMLGLALLFPLWRISLIAPQYPEGLGMHIWAHTVAGIGPNDLQNINGLNHYIGMKVIVPDSIPELRIMPPGIVAMCVLGLLIAWRGSRRLLQLWVVALVLAALVGLADFYWWEYDYGHNLDLEHAPIKVPGMTYQPPLIGSKKLLNFTATSWPATGGVLAIVAVMAAVGAALITVRESRPVNTQASNDGNARADASLRKATV